jgi:uncharacterized protein (TIGR02301 family)
MRKSVFAVVVLTAICSALPARGQEGAAPFDADLQRLAEILGTLHYLRGICGANEGAKWRNEMQALVDAETPTGCKPSSMRRGCSSAFESRREYPAPTAALLPSH